MKILHVMSEFPFPPDNGVRADIWGRLQAIRCLGHSIDAMVMNTKRVPGNRDLAEVRRHVNNLQFVERKPMRRCLASLDPTAVACNSPLAKLPLEEHYDLTLAEGDNLCPIFENPWLQTKLRALRVHNNESNRMWASASTEESFLRQQFCRLEALRFSSYSRQAFRRVDSLWFISQSEYQNYLASRSESDARAVWLAPSLIFGKDEGKRRTADSRRVLFVASFHVALNREALRWYLKEVHGRLTQDPKYELVVAGSTNGRAALRQFADEVRRERRCRVHVDVDDLTSIYDECTVFVNPMQRGAGVKLKNVHAIQQRVPVVTTSVGNDGSGFLNHEHVRVADTPLDFASCIAELLNNKSSGKEMAERAYSHLAKHYNCQLNIRRLFTSLLLESSSRSSGKQLSFRTA